jgi:hypothetical protein
VDDVEFRENPGKVMDDIHEFAGVKPFTYAIAGKNKEIEKAFDQAFPAFQKITGWRLDGKGLEMPSDLRKRVQEVRRRGERTRKPTHN